MRVLHIGKLDFEHDTGSGMAVYSLIEGLRALDQEIRVIKDSVPSEKEAKRVLGIGADIGFVSGIRLPRVKGFFQEVRRMLDWKPDLVHFHSAFIPAHPLMAYELRKRKIPYVITPHGALSDRVLKRSFVKKKMYLSLLELRYFSGASGFVALTENERQEILQIVPKTHIDVIPNAISADALDLCGQAFLQRKMLGLDVVRALFLGRYDFYNKGIDFLAQLVERVNNAGVPMNLEMHGVKPHRQKRAPVQTLDLKNSHIQMCGPVYGPEKLEAFSHCNLYMQTSRWEGFGMSVVEAMASGIPVVVTESMNIAPFVRASGGGIVVPFDLAQATEILVHALHNKEYLDSMGRKAREYILANLEGRRIASQTASLYASILQNELQVDSIIRDFYR